jgi:hypothetical protein
MVSSCSCLKRQGSYDSDSDVDVEHKQHKKRLRIKQDDGNLHGVAKAIKDFGVVPKFVFPFLNLRMHLINMLIWITAGSQRANKFFETTSPGEF